MHDHIDRTALLANLYSAETTLSGLFAKFGFDFAPVYLGGNIAEPGFYNIPALTAHAPEAVTYKAAAVPVSDTYTGTTMWNLLNTAGGVTTTTAKNDILSKYVIATG